MLAKVKDHPDLAKDLSSKGVVNVDNSGYNKYREQRARQEQLNKVLAEHEEIKRDVSEIKDMLRQLLAK